MKKILYKKYGSIDDLQLEEVKIPTVNAGQLLIKVKAVAINPLDWKKLEGQLKLITGKKFPKGIGFDFSGVVEKTSDPSKYKVGDAVFGTLDAMKGEALAEYIAVHENEICKKPQNTSFEMAAAILTGATTAIKIIEKSKSKFGDEIMINGASGAVGIVTLQLAKLRGLRVTAVASASGLEYIKKWNPDHLVDYNVSQPLESKNQYDAIIELAGTLPFRKAKNLLQPNGIYVSTLPTPKDMLKAFFNNLFFPKKNVIIQAVPTQEILHQISDWLSKETITIPIAEVFELADFKEAYYSAKKRGRVGKVIIRM